MPSPSSFTGRSRERRTRWGVRLGDWVARTVITVGGIGTIGAVLTVCLFLFAVVAPLFSKAQLESLTAYTAAWNRENARVVELNEFQHLGVAISPDGKLMAYDADSGTVIQTTPLIEGARPTLVQRVTGSPRLIFGFEDGSVRLGRLNFEATILDAEALSADLQSMPPGTVRPYEGGLLERTSSGLFRSQSVTATTGDELSVADGPIVAADLIAAGDTLLLATLTKAGKLQLSQLTEREDFVTGEKKLSLEGTNPVAYDGGTRGAPQFVALTGRGDNLYLAWKDGTAQRFDTHAPENVRKVQDIQLVDGAELTALQPILGRNTLVVGDSKGGLTGWFLVRRPLNDGSGGDLPELVRTKSFTRGPAAVTALAPANRSRVVAAGYADGTVRLYQVTSTELLTSSITGGQVDRLLVSPRDDGLTAFSGEHISRWELDLKHHETSLRTLFGKVWYEGYPEPAHVWQSTGGTDDAEPKLGLIPLIFGTLKATTYSMLFGAPLALLAALYTSEFLDRGMRARVKPAVEMMASLPSVVLGFLAALVFAPIVSDILPALAAGMFVIPMSVVFGALLWQLLPPTFTLRRGHWKIYGIGLTIPLGIVLAAWCGPLIERLLFSGDIKRWLDGRRVGSEFGSAWGGWMLMGLPLSALLTAFFSSRFVNPRLIQRYGTGDRTTFAALMIARFAAAILATLTIAALFASFLTLVGLDPRGPFVGTYIARNALIVGFVMGFAIIPIIYTLADDALVSVPESLRSASLGAGATPWQTAIRIVIPTAMSGLFSALMVGLGRAVGETMIVLMAGGNTAIMDLNPLNGFRTLSANIAVEIQDPPPGSTHFRTLFLCGLTLFVLTFLVNTLAELVRLRFRKRVYQL
jgi:phosphate transport system permease protein